jgi:hypothetical protein
MRTTYKGESLKQLQMSVFQVKGLKRHCITTDSANDNAFIVHLSHLANCKWSLFPCSKLGEQTKDVIQLKEKHSIASQF